MRDDNKTVTFVMSDELHDELKNAAGRMEMSMSYFVRQAIKEKLKKEKGK